MGNEYVVKETHRNYKSCQYIGYHQSISISINVQFISVKRNQWIQVITNQNSNLQTWQTKVANHSQYYADTCSYYSYHGTTAELIYSGKLEMYYILITLAQKVQQLQTLPWRPSLLLLVRVPTSTSPTNGRKTMKRKCTAVSHNKQQ